MSFFYDPFMESLEKVLYKHRSFLLDQIQGGDILEIGAGTGVNFLLYPKNVNIYAIEPSKPMYKRALKKIPSNRNIHLYNIGIEDIMNITNIPKQFDYILSTLVLCTIKNPFEAVQQYKQLLKSNGKLLVLEHIHSDGFYGKFQKIINPIWRPFADGCNLTRRQDWILKDAGFFPINEKYFHVGTDWYRAIMVKNIQNEANL